MTRFVKLRRRAKEIIVSIVVIMILLGQLSNIVNATGTTNLEKVTYTTYNFGVKTVTVIEGERPADQPYDPNNPVFYSEDDATLLESYLPKNIDRNDKDSEEKKSFESTYPGVDWGDFLDLCWNSFFTHNKVTTEEVSGYTNYNTIDEYLNGKLGDDDFDKPGYELGLVRAYSQFGITLKSNTETVDVSEEVPDNQEETVPEEDEESEGFLGGLLGGIISVFMNILRYIPVVIATGLGSIISSIGAAITGQNLANGLTLDAILFNRVELTSIDFFSTSSDDTVNAIRDNVAIWYVGIRNLAAVILAVILLYVGIRMAIASVAEDRARYKKMLFNWVVSLALLFLLHYIMQAVIAVNNSLVNIMQNTTAQSIADGSEKFEDVMNMFRTAAYDWNVGAVNGIAYALIYLLLTIMTFIFLLTYIKRMITIAFLIMIAPIITITYSIDKMGDGKSQALNAWLKEFIYNILIQPFHCIIYLALVNSSFQILNTTGNVNVFDGGVASNLGPAVFCFVVVICMYKAEDIVKNIFNFKASSMPQAIAQTAMFATALGALGKAGGKTAAVANRTRRNTPNYGRNGVQNRTGTNAVQTAQNNAGGGGAPPNGGGNQNTPTPPNDGGNQPPQTPPAGDSGQNGQGQQNDAGNQGTQRTTTGQGGNNTRGRRVVSGVKKVGGAILRNTVKATGYAVGLTLGAATGNVNVAISAMKGIGGATSGMMNNQKISSKQRHLAKAYNNFATEHPELDDKTRVAYSRKLLDQEIEPQTDAEREYVEAMRDMSDIYEQGGLSSDDAADKIEKTIKKIQDGEISEMSATQRYRAQANNYIDRYRNRTRRNNNNGGNNNNNTTP